MRVAQSCLTLCDPMDYTVHGILQARILEWVAFPFSRGSSQPRDRTHLPHCRQILYQLSHKGSAYTCDLHLFLLGSTALRPFWMSKFTLNRTFSRVHLAQDLRRENGTQNAASGFSHSHFISQNSHDSPSLP